MLVYSVGIGWLSDRLKHRFAFLMFTILIATAGLAVLLAQGDHKIPRGAKYAACFLTAAGTSLGPATITWIANNLSGNYKRNIGLSIVLMLGNTGSILGPSLFLQRESPLYHTGYSTVLGLLWMTGVCYIVLLIGMLVENRRRDRRWRR